MKIPFNNTNAFPVLVVYETFDPESGEWISNDEDCEVIEPGQSKEILLEAYKRRAVVGGIDVD